ncbi:hypothetical protein [Methylobacterium sp. JK268]
MRRVAAFACFVLLTCLAPGESFAVDGQQACTPDAQRLCASAGSDAQRVAACLRQHSRSLSPACRQAMSKGRRRG